MTSGLVAKRDMMPSIEALPRNRLLRALSPDVLNGLRPCMKLVPLKARRILHHSKLPIDQVYFIEHGLVSVIAPTDQDRQGIESWLIGSEGLVGLPTLLGNATSPHRRTVQVDGSAWGMRSRDLILAMDEIPELRRCLLQYAHSVLVQAAQIGACNARHSLEHRLARWLLMAQDRIEAPTLMMTQETVSKMLGVRRASVTEALHRLEQEGAITVGRGQITVLDRSALRNLCCHCYEIIIGEASREGRTEPEEADRRSSKGSSPWLNDAAR